MGGENKRRWDGQRQRQRGRRESLGWGGRDRDGWMKRLYAILVNKFVKYGICWCSLSCSKEGERRRVVSAKECSSEQQHSSSRGYRQTWTTAQHTLLVLFYSLPSPTALPLSSIAHLGGRIRRRRV